MAVEEYKTWLPVFPGFYGGFFDDYDTEEHAVELEVENLAEDYEIDENVIKHVIYARNHPHDKSIDLDYKEYHVAVARECCSWVEDLLRNALKDNSIKVEFEEIRSPREYNFYNDSINCKITLDLDKAIDYCKEHRDAFSKYLEAHFTRCSGFIPFYSNDIRDWLPYSGAPDWNSTQIGSVLDFIVRDCQTYLEDNPELELYYHIAQYVYANDYLTVDAEFIDILKSDVIKDISRRYGEECSRTAEYLDEHFKGNSVERNNLYKELSEKWLDAELSDALLKLKEEF